MAVGDQTGTHGERGMGRAASALPAPVHVQEVARPAQVQFHEDLRGRGRPCPRTAHGQFVAGCLGHWRVRARGCRLFRPHYPRLPSVIVVRIRYGVEINGRRTLEHLAPLSSGIFSTKMRGTVVVLKLIRGDPLGSVSHDPAKSLKIRSLILYESYRSSLT
ncbi:hypothetical protein EDB83DRAFT_182690 [Lactarius deliciosus]|nr:hypothetical protein EDB83DRAFT_182690 [Lactarius deliciosus]